MGNCAFSCGKVRVACGKVRVSCNISCGITPSVAFFSGALRGVGGREPILWYHDTFRSNDRSQWRAGSDEVVELQPSSDRASATFAQAVFSSGTAQDVNQRHGL